jgi:oligosaccharide repeat unit polymerase
MFLLWTIILSLNTFFAIYDLSLFLTILVLVNLVLFCFFSKLAFIIFQPKKNIIEVNNNYLRQILILVFSIIFALYFSYSYFINEIADLNIQSNPFLAIRQQLLVAFDAKLTPLSVTIAANFGVILIYVTFSSNINFFYKSLLSLLAFIAMIMPMSKGYLLMGICQILAIILIKDKINKVNIFILALLGFVLVTLSAIFRDNINLYEYFKIYIFSGLPAFDLILNGIFEFQYPVLYRDTLIYFFNMFGYFFNSNLQDNFVFVPEYTNIFTIFGPVISDYGILFSFIYLSIIGFISGIVYKYALFGNYYAKFLYGFVLFSILTSCFSDGFALISTYLKYAIIFFLLKIISSYRKIKV